MKKSLYVLIPCLLLSLTQANAVNVSVKNEEKILPPTHVEALPNTSIPLTKVPPQNQTTTIKWPDGHYTDLRMFYKVRDPNQYALKVIYTSCVDPNGKTPWAEKGFTTRPDQTIVISVKKVLTPGGGGATISTPSCVFENAAEFIK